MLMLTLQLHVVQVDQLNYFPFDITSLQFPASLHLKIKTK